MTGKAEIDALARLLEEGGPAEGEDATLSSLATMLREAAPAVPPMRAEFRNDLRAQVIDAARTRQAEPALMTRLRDRVQRFRYSAGLAGATGMASVALAGGGVAGAAEHAQPEELLYPTKIAIEDARLWLTRDDVARGHRALSYASDRLDEAELAAAEGDQSAAVTALGGAADRTREARVAIVDSGDATALLDLADAMDSQLTRINALRPLLDGPASTAVQMLLLEVETTRAAVGAGIIAPPTAPDDQGPIIITPAPGPDDAPDPQPGAPAITPPTSATDGVTVPTAPALPAPDPVAPAQPAPLPEVPDVDAPEVPGGGGVVQDVLEGVTDQVPDPVAPALDSATDAVDGLIPGQ